MSKDLAYWLGLMISDGCVRDNGAINFVSEDLSLTEFIRDFASESSIIRTETTKTGTPVFRWVFWSNELVDRLARYGIVPRKSRIAEFHRLPEPFCWDFLRGLLDGDGHVDQARRASFSTGSATFALGLSAFFSEFGFTNRILAKSRAYIVYLNVSSSRDFAQRIYRDGAPCLDRKRARFALPVRPPAV